MVFAFMFLGWCIRWSLATVFFVAVMAGAGYYVFHEVLQGGGYVKVPDVTMRPVTEATFALAEQDLRVGKQTHVADERVPKYYVIVQRPAPGKVVRTGRTVSLTVSAGTESLSPPNLVGKPLQKAEEEIRRAAFALGAVARLEHVSLRDTVIAQDPPATRLVSSDTRINLLVSDGQPLASFLMPDLTGVPVDKVEAVLDPLGLKPVPEIVDRPGSPMDVVLDQQPPAGTLVQQGYRVVYSVNQSESMPLPDARRWVRVEYVVPKSWFEREVRFDTIDRRGIRATAYPLESDYLNGQPPKFASGSTIRLRPLSFIDMMTVEIYLDGQLAQSYYYEGDSEPVITEYNVP